MHYILSNQYFVWPHFLESSDAKALILRWLKSQDETQKSQLIQFIIIFLFNSKGVKSSEMQLLKSIQKGA